MKKRVSSFVLAFCMCMSLLMVGTSAAYSTPTGDAYINFSGTAENYVRSGGTVAVNMRTSANTQTTTGMYGSGQYIRLTQNTATISSASGENIYTELPLTIWSVASSVMTYDTLITLENVTKDPGLYMEAQGDNVSTVRGSNGVKINVLADRIVMADKPVIHLVYDVDVTAGANGKVEYAAGQYMDPEVEEDFTDLVAYWRATGLTNAQASQQIVPGNNVMNKAATTANHTGANAVTATKTAATAQWGAGEDLTFTVTPDTHYTVKTVTAKMGTTDVSSYLTDNKNGTYTLNVPETVVTSANAKVTVAATFSGEDTTITSSVDAASPANSGTINPLGTQTVEYGTNKAFTITPASGYCVDTVAVTENGATTTYATTDAAIYNSTSKTWGYTFNNVAQAGTISVKFAVDANGDLIPDNQQVVLTFTAGDNGSFTSSSIPSDATGTDKTASYTIVRNKTDGAGKISATGNYTIVAADVATPVADTGYAFDLWKQGSTDLGVTDKTAPVGKVVNSDTTFAASFETSGHVDPDIPAKYELTFKFTLDANSTFEGPASTEITKYAVKYDGNHVPALDGIATLEANMVPTATGKFGYKFIGWTSASFTGTKQTADLDGMTFTGTTVTIQANSENAAAVLKVVEDSDVALGQWKNDTSFTYTVQLRIGDQAATQNEIKAVTVNGGELYRERTTDYPGSAADYLTLNAPVFTDYKTVEIGGETYGQMTMTLNKKDVFRSTVMTFTAAYNDGVVGSENNRDTFVAIVPGDVDRDGYINTYDVSILNQYMAATDKTQVVESQLEYAQNLMDMDTDGHINTYDISVRYQMIANPDMSN